MQEETQKKDGGERPSNSMSGVYNLKDGERGDAVAHSVSGC